MIKNILIVARSFYPQNFPRAFRAPELAMEFARQGHNVKVLTFKDPAVHIPFEKLHIIAIEDLGKRTWKLPKFGKSKPGYFFTKAVSRLFAMLFEFPAIEMMFRVSKKLKSETNHDLLISIAYPYPIHWGVAKAWNKKQKAAKTWVADCGDPYMMNKFDAFNKLFYFK